MANFDGEIRYAQELPPAAGPNVVGRAPSSTGLEYYAAAIGNLAGIFGDMKDAWQDTQFSTMKRQYDELAAEDLNMYSQTGDEAARNTIRENWSKRGEQIAAKYPNQMRNRFQLYLNQVEPQWAQNFAEKELLLHGRDLDDQMKINIQRDLENDNVGGAIEKYGQWQRANRISPAAAEEGIRNAPVDSVLAQVKTHIEKGEFNLAIPKLSDLRKMNVLSGERLEYSTKLLKLATATQEVNTDAVQVEVITALHTNRDKTPLEKVAIGEQLIEQLKTKAPTITGERFGVLMNRIEEFQGEKKKTHDPLLYVKLYRDVTQLKRTLEGSKKVRNDVMSAYGRLDDTHFESLNKHLEDTIETYNADVLSRLEKEAIPQIAPRLGLMEQMMTMSSADQAKYKNFIDRLQAPAKEDATRLALYLDQLRRWIAKNPDAPNFYENGKKILSAFEKYTPEQLRQMEAMVEGRAATLETMFTGIPTTPTKKYEVGDTEVIDGVTYTFNGVGFDY